MALAMARSLATRAGGLPPKRPRARAACRPASVRSANDTALKLGQGGKDMEHQLAARRGGVDRLGERAQADTALAELLDLGRAGRVHPALDRRRERLGGAARQLPGARSRRRRGGPPLARRRRVRLRVARRRPQVGNSRGAHGPHHHEGAVEHERGNGDERELAARVDRAGNAGGRIGQHQRAEGLTQPAWATTSAWCTAASTQAIRPSLSARGWRPWVTAAAAPSSSQPTSGAITVQSGR